MEEEPEDFEEALQAEELPIDVCSREDRSLG